MDMEKIIERKNPVPKGHKEIWLAGGCFWGAQKYMQGIRGVSDTSVGYANSRVAKPSYEQVCSHGTGAAETVHVVYDPAKGSLGFLLSLFFKAIDPTTVNRQGGDVGEQYRTGIYYVEEDDLPAIRDAINRLQKTLSKPAALEIRPLENYYLAEEYHQDYLKKNPQGYCHISDAMCKAAAATQPPRYERPDDAALRERLTDVQYRVTQEAATEPPFQNEYHDHFVPGIYVDITTGEPLFLSTDKFESGCGWPAFARPIAKNAVTEHRDTSHGMERVEVRSHDGDAHLGHVFTDGPAELGGVRYCINSAALRFIPREDMEREGYGDLLPLLDS